MISLPKGPGKKEGVFMFDTLKVAKRIRDGRNAKNMTQMELADKLGVSFQAVSNWERGASMPDISKLSDLSEILSISISELLGSEDKSSISVEKVIENEDLEISELIDVAPIIPPKTIEETVKEKKNKVKVDELVSLAPFLSSKALSELVEDLEVDNVSSLVALAPFLEEEMLSALLDKHQITDSKDLVAFAPFLDEDDLSEIVMNSLEKGCECKIKALSPFLSEECLEEYVMKAISSPSFSFSSIEGVLPHLDSSVVSSIFTALLEKGEKDNLVSLAPFMDGDDLEGVISNAIDKHQMEMKDIMEFAPFLDSDDLGLLIKKAIKRG